MIFLIKKYMKYQFYQFYIIYNNIYKENKKLKRN